MIRMFREWRDSWREPIALRRLRRGTGWTAFNEGIKRRIKMLVQEDIDERRAQEVTKRAAERRLNMNLTDAGGKMSKSRTYLFERIDGKLYQRVKRKTPYDVHRVVRVTAAEYAEYKRVKAEWRAMKEWVWGLEPMTIKADPKLKAEYHCSIEQAQNEH